MVRTACLNRSTEVRGLLCMTIANVKSVAGGKSPKVAKWRPETPSSSRSCAERKAPGSPALELKPSRTFISWSRA